MEELDTSIIVESFILNNVQDTLSKELIKFLHNIEQIEYTNIADDILDLFFIEIIENVSNEIIYIFKKHMFNIYLKIGIIVDREFVIDISVNKNILLINTLLDIDNIGIDKAIEIDSIINIDDDNIEKLNNIINLLEENLFNIIYELLEDVDDTVIENISIIVNKIINKEEDVEEMNILDPNIYDKIKNELSDVTTLIAKLVKSIIYNTDMYNIIKYNSNKYIKNSLNLITYYKKEDINDILNRNIIISAMMDILVINYIKDKEDYLNNTLFTLNEYISDEELLHTIYKIDDIFKNEFYSLLDSLND